MTTTPDPNTPIRARPYCRRCNSTGSKTYRAADDTLVRLRLIEETYD